jgi:hypothetical protein
VYRRDTGAGQFKGRYRVGGEVALFDAEGGSNIRGTEVFAIETSGVAGAITLRMPPGISRRVRPARDRGP